MAEAQAFACESPREEKAENDRPQVGETKPNF
jgi:hypothetical protein